MTTTAGHSFYREKRTKGQITIYKTYI
jgi:hypothetical protein